VVFKFVSLAVAENISQRIGFKKTIWISSFPFFLLIPLLIIAAKYFWVFFIVGALWGLHSGLYWWGYHGFFIKSGETKKYGHGIGEARFFDTLAIVTTPIVGAIITEYFGFSSTFILSAIFMILALLILGRDNDVGQKRDVKFTEVFSLVRSHKSVSLAYIGLQAEFIFYAVIWPLFLFLVFGRVISLGIIVSLATLIAALAGLGIGKFVDKRGERKIVTVGAPLLAISWFVRIFNTTLPSFIFADSLRNFGERMVSVPLTELTYKKALEGGSGRALLFRETTFLIGSIVALLTISVWIYFGGTLIGSFIFVVFFGSLPLIAIIKRRIHDKE
jgi:predicted MFS family arabinose efflux permease